MSGKCLQRFRGLVFGLWCCMGLVALLNVLIAIDRGWAMTLAHWAKYVIPLSIGTYLLTLRTSGVISIRDISRLAMACMLMGSIAYVIQYDPFHWLISLASAPLGSVPFTAFTVLEKTVDLVEVVFGVILCVWMARRTLLAIRTV